MPQNAPGGEGTHATRTARWWRSGKKTWRQRARTRAVFPGPVAQPAGANGGTVFVRSARYEFARQKSSAARARRSSRRETRGGRRRPARGPEERRPSATRDVQSSAPPQDDRHRPARRRVAMRARTRRVKLVGGTRTARDVIDTQRVIATRAATRETEQVLESLNAER